MFEFEIKGSKMHFSSVAGAGDTNLFTVEFMTVSHAPWNELRAHLEMGGFEYDPVSSTHLRQTFILPEGKDTLAALKAIREYARNHDGVEIKPTWVQKSAHPDNEDLKGAQFKRLL